MINFEMTEAIIFLKNGKRKYGILLGQEFKMKKDVFHFVPNTCFNLFSKTRNAEYIEEMPEALIEAIEIDLK
jgi:hypothetical protein